MKFIKKKNLHHDEDLLYVPILHWMYPIRHMALFLPFFLLLMVLWFFSLSIAGLMGFGSVLVINMAIRKVFLAALIGVLLVFVWRIFLYLGCEYGVTNKRLIIKKGIIRLIVAEIPIDRIESIYCTQGLLGKIFSYGTVRIAGIGGKMVVFFMVKSPFAFRRKIVEVMEKNKTITVVHGNVPRKESAGKPENEPLYRYGTFVNVLPGNGKQ